MSGIDMDIDDLLLDGSTQVHSRPSRFAPKGAKMKLRPKHEPSQPAASDSKKEEPEPECSNVADAMDTDVEQKPENGFKKEEEGDVDASTEADDDVVREIDVYFNAEIDPETQLYVIQFPLRPLWRPYELDERCEEVRVKLKTSEVEIDLTVDEDSKNYDSGADPRLLTKKLTLATNWIPSLSTDYAVGVLNENKLYLNPVHAVVQLRKSMRYLDPNEVSKGKSIASNAEPMEVKHLKASKMQTKTVEPNKESGEGWISLKYHGLRSNMATESLRKMMAQVDSPIRFSMSQHDYLDSLCPGTSRNNDNPKVPSRRDLSLPLNERFKSWLVKGAAFHRFDTLKYLAPDEAVEAVLEVLQELARLVQGLWVPKTSLVYGTGTGLEFWAREYVLLLFSKNPTVSSSQLPRKPQMAKAMEQVLNVLAVHRPSFSDWKLRELPDTNFIRQYPSIAKKQEEDWDHTEKKIYDQLGLGGKSVKTSSKSNAGTNTMTPKSSNNSVAKPQTVLPLRTAMPQEVREAVVNALEKLFKAVKVCSFRQISQRLREIAVSESTRSKGFSSEAVTAADNIDAYPNDLQAVISQVAYNIHGVCVPISSPDYPEYDAYRKVVIDLFIAEGANAKLKRGQILEAAKLVVKKELPFPEYLKVLREMCTAQGSVWVLKTGEQKAVN